jgi:glycosyltransferase involved in cell wall biosynthesis
VHVLIATVSAATSPAGVCRHAANIAHGLATLSAVHKITICTGSWQADYFRDAFHLTSNKIEIVRSHIENTSFSRNLWYLQGLPAAARACGADIVHLAYPMPFVRSAFSAPIIVSLHDLYPIDIPSNFGRRAWLNRAALKSCLRHVDAITCVSEETRTRLQELFSAETTAKARVVPNSISFAHAQRTVPVPDAIGDRPFLLCVAQHRANKNLPFLLRSFRAALDRNILSPRTMLVLVGNEGPETALLNRVIVQCALRERVLLLRGISDDLLQALYQRCDLLIAPSLLEGFGLPVAEALACSCRVVASDIAAFREIAAASAVFFDPADDNGESLIAALREAMTTPRSSVTASPGLNPEQAAVLYLDLYAELLARKHSAPSQPQVTDPAGDSHSTAICNTPSERHSL